MSEPLTEEELIINFNTTPVIEDLNNKQNVSHPDYIGPRKWNKKSKKYELIFNPTVYPKYYRNKYIGTGKKIIKYDYDLKTLLKRLYDLCNKAEPLNKNATYELESFPNEVVPDKIKFNSGGLSDAQWSHEGVSQLDKANTSNGGKRKTRRGRRKSNRKSKKITKRRTRKH